MGFWQIVYEKGWYFLITLLGGWPATATVAAGSLVFALFFGLFIAFLRLSNWRILRFLSTAYVEVFRGTPALVQLFVIYFGLPDIGFNPSPFQSAIIGLGSTARPICPRSTGPASNRSIAGRWKPH